LNICRTIIEFHHGRLSVEDNPGAGTVFRFSLPRGAAADAASLLTTQPSYT
jgi:signal transduction histidine kinase